MRLASWRWGGRLHAGLVTNEGREVTPLALPPADVARGALALVQMLAAGEPLPRASGTRLLIDAVTLCAPFPQPLRGIFCAGRNYRAHAAELATTVFRNSLPEKDEWPIVFTKYGECVVGPHDDVRLPGRHVTTQVDYEGELCVVIGRGGRDISRAMAMEHVFGYTVCNDVSARDVQVRHQQWDLGKGFDTFMPLGPCIVGVDEIDGRDLRLRTWVNGDLRQDGRTRDLIFDIPTLIETCSRGITLFPGDLIATGTPSGVGMGFEPPKWLTSGDVVRVEVDGIGAIQNQVRLMALHVIERVVIEDDGEGDAVVCVHGLGGSSNTFTPLMPALARHRVVRIDLPGSGRSQRADGALNIDRFVDCVQAVCARLNITRAHCIGHSMGTIVLQHLAVNAPKLVRSLALFGPLIAPPDAARTALKRVRPKPRDGVTGMHEITAALLNASISADTRQRQPLAVAYVRESLMRQDGEAYARSCEALAGTVAAAVERIECPVLLVTGDEDGVAPPQAVRGMADKLHGARSTRVVVFPRCGHWTPVERADECQRELREFLAAQR